MQTVNCKINDVCGALTLAHPMCKAEYGKIIQITEVPDGVQPGQVLRQAGRIAFWPVTGSEPFRPTVIPWSTIATKQAGAIFRY